MLTNFLKLDYDEIRETDHFSYCKGYKYQTRSVAIFKTKIFPEKDIVTELIILRKDGILIVGKFYAFDGPSGPTWDTKTNLRAALGHDALYELMRKGLLGLKWRAEADQLLHDIMIEDGAWSVRADYYQWAVDKFAEKAASEHPRKVYVAP